MYIIWNFIIVKEDFESGKIKNHNLIVGLKIIAIIFSINLILTIIGELGHVNVYLDKKFYLNYSIHLIQSILFSYILWYGEIWPAGDSKFYTVNMLFLPLANPSISDFPKFLWLSILINTFILSAIYSIFIYVKENIIMLKENNKNAFREIKDYYINKLKNLKVELNTIFIIFSLFSAFLYKQILNLLLQKYVVSIFHRNDIFFFILYFLWPKISNFFHSKYWKYLTILLYIFVFFYLLQANEPQLFIKDIFLTSLKNTFKFGIILTFGKVIFEEIIESYYTYYAGKDEIKPGMILSTQEIKIFRKDDFFKGVFDNTFKDGLNQEQVEAIKKWMERHPLKDVKIKFIKSRPFAFNIFLGCLFQLIFNTNILRWII